MFFLCFFVFAIQKLKKLQLRQKGWEIFGGERLSNIPQNFGIILPFGKGSDCTIFHDFTGFFTVPANILRYQFFKWKFQGKWLDGSS